MALTEDEKEKLKSDRYGAVEEIRYAHTTLPPSHISHNHTALSLPFSPSPPPLTSSLLSSPLCCRNRRTRHGILEYEVKFVGMHERENKYLTREDLEARGFGNLIKQADERVAAEAAGLDIRYDHTEHIYKRPNSW
jgi:hypothetical protein